MNSCVDLYVKSIELFGIPASERDTLHIAFYIGFHSFHFALLSQPMRYNLDTYGIT